MVVEWWSGGVVEWWWWSYLSRNVSEILRSARAIEASIASPCSHASSQDDIKQAGPHRLLQRIAQCCFCRGADR